MRYYSRSQGQFVEGEPPAKASGVSSYLDEGIEDYSGIETPVTPTLDAATIDKYGLGVTNPEDMVRSNQPQQGLSERIGSNIFKFGKSLVQPTLDYVSSEQERLKKQGGLSPEDYIRSMLGPIGIFLQKKEGGGFEIDKEGAKAAANMASFMIPFGKGAGLASKVLLPGAGVGALQAFSEKEATLPSIVSGAALGSAGAGVLHGAGKLVGKVVSGITKKLPTKIMEGVFKEPLKATKAGVRTGKTLGKEALEKGEAGTTEQIYTRALTKIQELENELQSKLINSNATVKTTSIRKTVNPMVKELIQAGDNSGAQSILDRISAIEKASGTKIPVSQANQIKRTIYDEVRRSYGAQGSAGTELLKSLGRAIKEEIAKVPGIGNINKNLSYYGRVADSMADKIARTGRNNLISLTDMILGVGVPVVGLPAVIAKKGLGTTIGQTAIAKGLSSIGNKLPTISPTILGQIGARAAQALPSITTQGTPQPTDKYGTQNAPEQGITRDYNLPPLDTSITEVSEPVNITGYSAEQLGRAYSQAVMNEDEDTAKQLKELYDTEVEYQKTAGGKDIVAAVKVRQDLSRAGLRARQDAEDIFKVDPNIIVKGMVTGGIATRKFDSAMSRAVEGLLRARSGAAVPESEVKKYIRDYGPRIGDSQEVALYKLEQLRLDLMDVFNNSENVVPDNTLPEIEGTSQNFNNPAVGQTVANTLPKITQAFGIKNPKIERFSRGGINRGVDLRASAGTSLYVPEGDWKVMETYRRARGKGRIGNRTNRGYGNSVVLRNTQTGERLRLSHLSGVAVKAGQVLESGSFIGKSGATGNVTAAHLDLEYTTSKGKLADASKTRYIRSIFNPLTG